MLHWLTTFFIQKVIKITPLLVQKLELHWEGSTLGCSKKSEDSVFFQSHSPHVWDSVFFLS